MTFLTREQGFFKVNHEFMCIVIHFPCRKRSHFSKKNPLLSLRPQSCGKKQPHYALRRPCRNTDLGKIKVQSAKRLWKTRVWQEVLKLPT